MVFYIDKEEKIVIEVEASPLRFILKETLQRAWDSFLLPATWTFSSSPLHHPSCQNPPSMPKSDEDWRDVVEMFGISIQSGFSFDGLGHKSEIRCWVRAREPLSQNEERGEVALSRKRGQEAPF
ncbi:hypothetical protein AVEN_32848-1 [Araneus ventricosus]|uniref:Uncharacterized protein n=1 Tax=Araneus ventricosus TaxID=182803 RepID=A0A4Y2DYB2_ARAVE|nr:hypothetical protein AVEN_32848-1 [Araneus ventricosus]